MVPGSEEPRCTALTLTPVIEDGLHDICSVPVDQSMMSRSLPGVGGVPPAPAPVALLEAIQ